MDSRNVTDAERAMQRAKNPGKSSWRAWHGTSEQVKRDKEKAEQVAPLGCVSDGG